MSSHHQLSKPARLPHREFEEVREVDPDGRIVVHNRLVDSLGRMRKSGAIDRPMYAAARAFQASFTIANLDPIRATPIQWMPGSGREPDLNHQQIHARRRVHAAMQALGGINSPAGSCLWHVVGLQHSLRAWAMRQGWNGRPVRQEQAQGILVAALGVLAVRGARQTRITSDAGLLASRELDDALGLSAMAGDLVADARTGRVSALCERLRELWPDVLLLPTDAPR